MLVASVSSLLGRSTSPASLPVYLKTSGVLLILLFGALLGWIFGFVPADAYMGFSQKIMYVHVPAIWVAYLAFFVVFVASIGYLWRRHPLADRLAAVSAELGVLFCAVGLISGAIWGRPTWGVYWVWDARLTTTLLLLLIFLGYVLLRVLGEPGARQARLAAVLAIIGFLDVPLIHLSVKWWRTLHQPSSLLRSTVDGVPDPSLPPVFLGALLASIFLQTLLYAWMLAVRWQLAKQSEQLRRAVQ